MATDSTNWSRKRRCRSLSPPSRKARKGGPEETAGEVAVGILPTVSLGHVLLSSLEDGHFADVAVAIEGRGVVMKAHKIVLASGSEVFKTKLTNPQWAGVDPMKVSLPAGVSFDGAKVFIKFLYVGRLEERAVLTNGLLLELRYLSDMFLVEKLKEECSEELISRVNVETCLDVYQKTKQFGVVADVCRVAYRVLLTNLEIVLSNTTRLHSLEGNTWERILKEDYLDMDEAKLFNFVLAWRDGDLEGRMEKFKILVRFIRFPLMGAKTFSECVVPYNVLTSEEVVQLFVYFARDGLHETSFNHYPRRRKFVDNPDNVKEAIINAKEGDIIILPGGTIQGEFTLEVPGVTILGADAAAPVKTVITGVDEAVPLTIIADRCKLENFSLCNNGSSASVGVFGDCCQLRNLTIGINRRIPTLSRREDHSDHTALFIRGSRNITSNITISGHKIGITVSGENNLVEACSITGGEVGIYCSQFDNEVRNVEIINAARGVDLRGIQNALCKLKYVVTDNSIEPRSHTAILATGKYLKIEDVVCSGMRDQPNQVFLDIGLTAKKLTVSNSGGGGKLVIRGKQHTFQNLDVSLIKISGTKHKLTTVRARGRCIVEPGADATYEQCQLIFNSGVVN